MKHILKKIVIASILIAGANSAIAQQDELEEIWRKNLRTEVQVENPTYRPVIGIGTGCLTFWGDLQNQGNSSLLGNSAFKINLSGFIDKKRNFKWNVFWLNGQISGKYVQYDGTFGFINFKTSVNQFGANLEYTFNSLFKRGRFHPYISVGFAPLNFSPMGDFLDKSGALYTATTITKPDGNYESNLKKYYKNLNYSENTFTVPIDAGLDFTLHDRIGIRLGASYNITFSDELDNISPKTVSAINSGTKGPKIPTSLKVNSSNDAYLFTYLALNFDLFSDRKSYIITKLAMDIENEPTLQADQDWDGILDPGDDCPDTPSGVKVNDFGCPLDTDADGVPDYLDADNRTPVGSTVNNKGVAITKEDFSILDNQFAAVRREDARIFLANNGRKHAYKPKGEMPAKYASVDTNKDGDISYDELKRAVDDFLDKKSNFTAAEISEIYEYFFAQ
ncbi:hypothetical protein [uncultured Acetobacteroides sp.]|uniref:hypothetical protein n=1 Tax=uncultured Acetobacteroides sp. TaxID=1760811 RepID=UPI0029F4C89D|nr:hypothetical protein [uncultured Acetobacteroides sp.]